MFKLGETCLVINFLPCAWTNSFAGASNLCPLLLRWTVCYGLEVGPSYVTKLKFLIHWRKYWEVCSGRSEWLLHRIRKVSYVRRKLFGGLKFKSLLCACNFLLVPHQPLVPIWLEIPRSSFLQCEMIWRNFNFYRNPPSNKFKWFYTLFFSFLCLVVLLFRFSNLHCILDEAGMDWHFVPISS